MGTASLCIVSYSEPTAKRITITLPVSRPAVPPSAAIPAAAAKQQNENYNDEKRGHIHV